MSNVVVIEQPHGYLLDGNGQVIQRFGGWDTGEREVHPATDSAEYVDGPASHQTSVHEDYKTNTDI